MTCIDDASDLLASQQLASEDILRINGYSYCHFAFSVVYGLQSTVRRYPQGDAGTHPHIVFYPASRVRPIP
jgi:hypothetical protein